MSNTSHLQPGRFLLATTNKGKLREFRSLLSGWIPETEILSLGHFPPMDPPAETGDTFQENARIKAKYYSLKAKGIFVVAEDSGLVVPVLNGEPGVRSSRYAGPNATDRENLEHLLYQLTGRANRVAFFFTAGVVAMDGKILFECQGRVNGEILKAARGNRGFGYDPVFYHPELNRSFAQISSEEKNRVSHRGQAMTRIRDFLLKTAK